MKTKSMNEIQAMARPATTPNGTTGPEMTGQINASTIEAQLGGQLARPDMGAIRNFRAARHEGKLQLTAFNALASEKCKQLTELAVDALKAEAALVREHLRVEFQRRYASIAERAAAGQIEVTRKLESVLAAARELLLDDRADALERIVQRHDSGRLSDDDLRVEIAHTLGRYAQILADVTAVIDERRQCVRGAYQSNPAKS
jgi:hypothetical protein